MSRFFFFMLLLHTALIARGQSSFTITGTIRNELGQPVEGASVNILGNNGTYSDEKGHFSLVSASDGVVQLEIRFLGYQPWNQEIRVPLSHPLEIRLSEAAFSLQTLELIGTWAGASSPFTSTHISGESLKDLKQGQDIPWLLRFTPNMVSTSDAGTGIGYTGMRIRGSDPTRTNVTINGVPINDSESQAVFWVNMPDFASSTEQIEIQRGVGTSTNGAGAFGATINLQSLTVREQPYSELQIGAGSFQTRRATVSFGTGNLGNGWSFDGRWSRIYSGGFVDRATANLESLYGSITWKGAKSLFRVLAFTGNERTYQSWWGTPESRINNDVPGMLAHAERNGYTEAQTQNLLESGRSYNYYTYKNEVDQYTQTHAQAHWAQAINTYWHSNVTLHYTQGAGYFEQFRENDGLSNYGLVPVVIGGETITRSDIVRRRWLDNHFAGMIANVRYERQSFDFHLGGGWNRYLGDHFGRIIWSSMATSISPDHQYYFGDAQKTDGNLFLKTQWRFAPRWESYIDLQYRHVAYETKGTENNLQDYDVNVIFPFFNPKIGITWALKPDLQLYSSLAVGHREPLRRDFVDAPEGTVPQPERMVNAEAGLRWRTTWGQSELNFYHMQYKDQLIPTGALNDVGASLLTNVARSWRSGMEISSDISLSERLNFRFSLGLSDNKIKEFEEVIYDYTVDFEVIRIPHTNVDIAFSPQVVYNHQLKWKVGRGWSLGWMSQFVSKHYLDNTSNNARVLPSWWVQDGLVSWEGRHQRMGHFALRLQVNNLLDLQYSNNGYTYTYIAGNQVTENFYYPQAGRHLFVGLAWSF